MTPAAFPDAAVPSGGGVPAAPPVPRLACAVRLIDRRTGQGHRVNGTPLVLFTRNPEQATTDLLEGRDAAVWEARIEPIETGSRK